MLIKTIHGVSWLTLTFLIASAAQAQIREVKLPKTKEWTEARFRTISYSPDGKYIAAKVWKSSNIGEVVVLWDAKTLKYSGVIPSEYIHAFAFSGDSRRLFVYGTNERGNARDFPGLIVFDVSSLQEIFRHRINTRETFVDICPRGKSLMFETIELLKLYSLDDLKKRPLEFEVKPGRNEVRVSRSGEAFAVSFRNRGEENAAIELYNTTGETVATTKNRYDRASGIAFHPDGKHLIANVFRQGGHLVMLDAHTLKEVKRFEPHHGVKNFHKSKLSISPNGKFIAALGDSNSVLLFDGETGTYRGNLSETGWFSSFSFSPDSKWIASASGSGKHAYTWEIAPFVRSIEPKKVVKPGKYRILDLAIDPAGKTVVSSDDQGDEALRIWNFDDFSSRIVLDRDSKLGKRGERWIPGNYRCLDLSREGKLLFVGQNNDSHSCLYVYDIGKGTFDFMSDGIKFDVRHAFRRISSDNLLLRVGAPRTGGGSDSVKEDSFLTINTKSWKVEKTWKDNLRSNVYGFLPNEEKLLTAYGLYDVNAHKLHRFPDSFECYPFGVASKDNSTLIGGRDYQIRILDRSEDDVRQPSVMNNERIHDAVFSTDEKLIATACSDRTVRIWSYPKFELLLTLPHANPAKRVVLSANNKRAVSTDEEGFLYFWEFGQQLTEAYSAHTAKGSGGDAGLKKAQ